MSVAATTKRSRDDDLEQQPTPPVTQPVSRIVRLNVGGTLFQTLRSTLCADSDSLLAALIDGSAGATCERDADGTLFLDRDGSAFRDLLDCLRSYPALRHIQLWSGERRARLRTEADYFSLRSLIFALDGTPVRFHVDEWVSVCGGESGDDRSWTWRGRRGNVANYPVMVVEPGPPERAITRPEVQQDGTYLVIVRHLSRPSPRMPAGQRYGDPSPNDRRVYPANPFLSVSVPSLNPVGEYEDDGFVSKMPINLWTFDDSKNGRDRDSYSNGLVTLSACEILPLQSGDSISFNWNWRGSTSCSDLDCNPTRSPPSLLYSFTLLRMVDATALACFDRHVTTRTRSIEWRPRHTGLPASPFVVSVENGGVLTVPSPGNYLLLSRLAVGIDDTADSAAGEGLALQARTAHAGLAGWVDLCSFGRCVHCPPLHRLTPRHSCRISHPCALG